MSTNIPDKIIVHHSAFVQQASQLAQINQWHKDRDFLLSSLNYYVGYHFLIANDGTVTRTKNDDEEGCHTIGQNLTSLGVCMEGDFNQEFPSLAQEKALGKLLVELCDKHGISYMSIYPHRKYANTSCCGTKLPDNWVKIVCVKEKIVQLIKTLLEKVTMK